MLDVIAGICVLISNLVELQPLTLLQLHYSRNDTHKRLIVSENSDEVTDRFDDMITLFDAANSNNGKQALAESLEAFKNATDLSTGNVAFSVSNKISDVYPYMYHYIPEDDFECISLTGSGTFQKSAFPDGEHYLTPEIFNDPVSPKIKLQLPPKSGVTDIERARYRCKVDAVSINNDFEMPYGYDIDGALITDKLEPLTRQNPSYGVGGSKQFTNDQALTITEIYDTVAGRILTESEVSQLVQGQL